MNKNLKEELNNLEVKNVCNGCNMLLIYRLGNTQIFYRDGMHQCGSDKNGKLMSFCNDECEKRYYKKMRLKYN